MNVLKQISLVYQARLSRHAIYLISRKHSFLHNYRLCLYLNKTFSWCSSIYLLDIISFKLNESILSYPNLHRKQMRVVNVDVRLFIHIQLVMSAVTVRLKHPGCVYEGVQVFGYCIDIYLQVTSIYKFK